jgi:hypothetical protein
MSHPHFHALSSAWTLGGAWTDYFAVHAWFDASKSAYADTRHRAVLHHDLGLALLRDRFGGTLVRYSDGVGVDLGTVGAQHLREDCGRVPALADWLRHRPLDGWIERACVPVDQAACSAARLGGSPDDYAALHAWLDQGVGTWADPRAHAPLHSAFGIFLAEARFGATLVRGSDGRHVPTRLVAEAHVLRAHGRIPTVADWMGAIPAERWMARAATPLSRVAATRPTEPRSHAGAAPSPVPREAP